MKHSYEKQVDNVLLRPLRIDDIESIRLWRNNPVNTKYLRKIPHITADMQRKWFESNLLDSDELSFAIIETQSLKRLVGSISIYDFERNQVEIGKVLVGDPEAHGKNVCTNATKAAVRIIFEELKVKKAVLHVYKDNIPAVIAYERAGFRIVDEHEAGGMREYLMCIEK